MECKNCSRGTKYFCISCKKPSCQVCSIVASENDNGYNEEEKCVSFCKMCASNKTNNDKDDEVKVTGTVFKKPPQLKQRTLTSLLVRNSTSGTTGVKRKDENEKNDVVTKKEKKVTENKPSRTVTATTVNKWKDTILAEYDAHEWLTFDIEGHLATNLRCKICTKFKNEISNMEMFNDAWIVGSRNYRPSNAQDHATGKPHTRAFELHLRSQGKPSKIQEREQGQTSITEGVNVMNKNDFEKTKKKFEVAYFCAKEEISFEKYSKILDLEEIHSVDIGNAYRNHTQCGNFIDVIAEEMSDDLCKDLGKIHFFSVLWDGATDVSATEKETLFVKYLDWNKPNKVEVVTRFLGLEDVGCADADGLVETIDNGFKNIGIVNYKEKLVGLGADGASVNRGTENGVQAKLKEEMPWLIYIWCMNHRLELAVKDAFKNTYFERIDEMLLRLYYMYENSPKKLHELKEVYEMVRKVYDFDSNGIRPIRASGTRWLAHKSNAISRIIDKFGIYIIRIENIASEQSNYTKEQKSKALGYLKEWKTAKMLLHLCFYADILAPLKQLSLIFQKDGVDTVEAADSLLKAKRCVNRMFKQDIASFPNIALLKKNIESNGDGSITYQNVKLSSLDTEIGYLESKKVSELSKVKSLLVSRLEDNDSEHLDATSLLLNCSCWSSLYEMNESFADEHVLKMFHQFEQLLQNAGFSATNAELLEEWHDLLAHTIKYFSPDTNSYKKTWKRIFSASQSKKKFSNILLLIESIFCLPVSASVCERSFSLLKRTKSDSRACLGVKRLESLMRISLEGPSTTEYDVSAAVQRWSSEKERRPRQKRNRTYKDRVAKLEEDFLSVESDIWL